LNSFKEKVKEKQERKYQKEHAVEARQPSLGPGPAIWNVPYMQDYIKAGERDKKRG